MDVPDAVRDPSSPIRHVEGSLSDNPVGVLQVARFAAATESPVASATRTAMEQVAPALEDVESDRLADELVAAVTGDHPRVFFDRLVEADALKHAYPALDALRGVPAGPEAYHEEGDSYEHTMRVLTEMSRLHDSPTARFAALAHDLGKAETPDDRLPHHYGHAKAGEEVAEAMGSRLSLPERITNAMTTGARLHMKLHDMGDLNTTTVLDMADRVRGSSLAVEELVALGRADRRGRKPQQMFEDAERVTETLQTALDVLETVDIDAALDKRGYDRDDIGDEVSREQAENLVRQDRAEALRAEVST